MCSKNKPLLQSSLAIVLLVVFAILIFIWPKQGHIVLLVIAAILIFLGIKSLIKYNLQSNWLEKTAKIKHINEIEEEVYLTATVTGKYYYPSIEYEYTLDGKLYTNNLVAYEKENIWVPETNNWGDPTPTKERWWLKLKQGEEIPVYINPNNKNESVLIQKVSKNWQSHHLALIVGGLIIIVLWGVLIVST